MYTKLNYKYFIVHGSHTNATTKGETVTSAGWQVTLCDPIWHVSSCSSEVSCNNL